MEKQHEKNGVSTQFFLVMGAACMFSYPLCAELYAQK